MKRLFILLLCLVSLVPLAGFAQDDVSQKMTIQAGYGTVTMDGVQWQRFSFRPDFPIGKFGIGLDIELFIDSEGKVSDEGWDFSNKNKMWDNILRKIYYVRYGKPLDRFYIRAGALDNVTLGYGLIMDGYCNTLTYPADKKLGVDLSVRDIGTFGIDIHGMVNSVGDLKNKGAVVGGRVAFKPLKPTQTAILSKLTFGVSFVRDINQYAGLKDTDNDGYPDSQDGFPDDKNRFADTDRDGYEDNIDIDSDGDNIYDFVDTNVEQANYFNIKDEKDGVTVAGFDAGIPLIEGRVNLDLYGQYAKIHTGDENNEGGWGTGAPGLRLLAGRFKGQIEYRHFEGRFIPNYFDNLYEHDRVVLAGTTLLTKKETLPNITLNGVYGRAGYNFFDILSLDASYQVMSGDDSYHDLTGIAKILDRALNQIPKIKLADAYFFNRRIEKSGDIFKKNLNTLYGYRIGYELMPSLLVVWDTRYTFVRSPGGGLESQRFVSIETVMTMR